MNARLICQLRNAALRTIGLSVVICSTALGQGTSITPGLPGKNISIVGPTPNVADIPDFLLRQQNEPDCIVQPENPAYIFCAFNDYRATDLPFVQGDSWIGVSWSADFGKTWFSRLAPGFRGHPNSLNQGFAADPNVEAIPGNSPGLVFLSYIAAARDLNDGVLAIQRWAATPQEDINYYVAEDRITSIDTTNSGRFADKPTLLAIVDAPDSQTNVPVTLDLEDGTTVTRNVPSGLLVMAYAVFTGSNSSKIYIKTSSDWGATWSGRTKISEEQVRVQGVSLSNIGDTIVAGWRRADKKGDKIITSVSTSGGRRWTKGRSATDLCALDQAATGTQIRMIDFPWLANDGERFYIFAADRRFGGSCEAGIPKIGMSYSGDGRSWTGLEPLEDSMAPNPGGEPSGEGYQFIPAAVGFRGNVQVAWYDTRRETYGAGLPAPQPIFMQDYLAADGTIVNRKADIYTARVRENADGIVEVSPAIRVSQYRTGRFIDPASGAAGLLETEGHFPNTPIFERGTRAFNGDYIAAAATPFRQRSDGLWIQNSLSTNNDLTDREDVWLAWGGDTRDLRGVYLPSVFGEPTPFTPNNEATAMANVLRETVGSEPETLLAEDQPPGEQAGDLTAESLVDFAETFGLCVAGDPQDRTRDANVYGAVVRDVSRFIALTPTKPLNGFQTTHPIIVTNPSETDSRSFTLRIENQPSEFAAGLGQASWKQLPSRAPFGQDPRFPAVEVLPVTVPAKSTVARTLFLSTSDDTTSILVNLYDASCAAGTPECPVLSSILVGAGSELRDSAFCSDKIGAPGTACEFVDVLETHDPILQTPDLQTPDLQTARLLSPDLQTPDLQTPDLQTPDLQTLGFMTPDLQSPDLQTPDLQTPDLQTPDLQTPDLQTPDLQTPDLQTAAYQDITYTVQNVGNVTTTYSTDMSFTGIESDALSAQLIAWTTYVTGTSRACEFLPQGESQILASKNLTDAELASITLPTVDDPFAGPVSFAARPGQVIHVTLRVFGPLDQLNSLSADEFIAGTGFGASAHSCSDSENIDPETDCLTLDQEKILLDRAPPSFNVPDNFVFNVEADRPGGACVDLVGSGAVSADDNGIAIIPECIANATGTAVCTDIPGDTALPIPLSQPGLPTGITCSATDTAGNTGSVQLFVDVRDNGAPLFNAPLGDGTFAISTSANEPAASPTGAIVTYPLFTAADVPLVDESVDITCTPASGTLFGIGATPVSCSARDDGFNDNDEQNEATATFVVTVNDATPPVGTSPIIPTVEANAEGGADFDFPLPAFEDNFDSADDLLVSCSPAPPAFFALGTNTVNCDASDTSGNTAALSFDIEVADTRAPIFDNVPTSPLIVPIDASGGGSLNFESQVTVSDFADVDPNPSLTCEAAGGIGSGDPLPLGDSLVTCTATDASGNIASATYTVRVQYGIPFGISFNNGKVKAGSTVPLSFGWTDGAGGRIDSSAADPVVSARQCDGGGVVLEPGFFPGNSDLRYDASQREWKFNWQTVLMDGSPIPATRNGTRYCLQVESRVTGQTIPVAGFDEVTVRR